MKLHIAISFPLSIGVPGGGTEDCLKLARFMQRSDAQVTLLCAMSAGPGTFPRRPPSREAFDEVARELRSAGIEVIPVTAHPLSYLLDGRPMRKAVAELMRRQTIDALLGWWHEAAFLPRTLHDHGVLFAINAAASYKLAFPYQSPWRHPLRALRAHYLVRRPLQRAEVIFARSMFTRGEITEFAGVEENIHVVPCGVERRFTDILAMPVESPQRLFYFGRLLPEKGIFDTIAALGRISSNGYTDWRLRVAGWGDVENVQAQARVHGIHDRVDLLGPLEIPALVEELARAKLAILPSYSESFGLANAEAQAAGLPVVAYAAGAVPEVVVDGETGWLVPTGDREALSRAVQEALSDPQEAVRRGRAGRERMLAHFTWEKTAAATLEGLAQAIENKRRRGC